MTQPKDGMVGQKRGAGRPPKAAQPALKKTRISSAEDSPLTSLAQSPAAAEPRTSKLPSRLYDNKPLPTLSTPQSTLLSKDEYQSMPTSGVLQASLDRSRLRWVSEGVFERYWTKPETGKNARPAPPHNPDVKLQKSKGPCRIRIEPHIFEADLYVEEKPKPPVKQYAPPSAYGQPYRPGQQAYGQQQNPYYQGRSLPPVQQPHTQPNQPPRTNGVMPSPAPTAQSPSPAPEKKNTPDPVIGMLANRASSDPELKALMKEVATGNATPDQLKIFQGHIDELSKVISDKKKKEGEDEAATQPSKTKAEQSDVIQYDGPADTATQQPQQAPYQATQQPVYQQPQQQQWTAPPPPQPTPQPVLLAFTTPGATEDRFLFPPHSILEDLSPQHLLASFIVTRKGREAADPSGLDPETEYWQPVTLMVEVAYNREHLLGCVRRWVKPAEEVRKAMEEVMGRCTRAPDAFLAPRLPFKGSAVAMEETEVESGVSTPVHDPVVRPKKTVKYVKKVKPAAEATAAAPAKKDGAVGNGVAVATAAVTPAPAKGNEAEEKEKAAPGTTDGAADAPEANEGGRPKRAVRRSVRISEG